MNHLELKEEINYLRLQDVCTYWFFLVELNANVATENRCTSGEAAAVTGPLCNLFLRRTLKTKQNQTNLGPGKYQKRTSLQAYHISRFSSPAGSGGF